MFVLVDGGEYRLSISPSDALPVQQHDLNGLVAEEIKKTDGSILNDKHPPVGPRTWTAP